MKLLEHVGKDLLKQVGIRIPPGIVTDNKSYINLSYHKEQYKEFFFEHKKVLIKAQVISGKRKKQGLIEDSEEYVESLKKIAGMYEKEFKGAPITTLLIEKKLNVKEEYFLSITYDTRSRAPIILLSKQGGIDIEEQEKPKTLIINSLDGLNSFQARQLAKEAGFKGSAILQIASILTKAYGAFIKFDCKQLEINPLIKTEEGLLFAADAKITIDDNAIGRQDIFSHITDIEDQSFLSPRELEARKIDYHDHRGVAGKTFVDLDGDIAVLASGGGASLTSMDSIIQADGKPANYTEYSGNPPKEKVVKLTKITLKKENLNGCLVIGGKANFTDIFETLSGFIEVVKELKPTYPIVIRRAGPRDKEAFELIRKVAQEENLNITLFGEETPMSKAAHIMVEKVNEYKEKKA